MTDDNNPTIPNSAVGTNTNGGHENDGNALINELKSENSALKATVQVLQTEFAEKVKQYENEIAELKKKVTEQNDVSEAKQKLGTIIQTGQQEIGEMAEQEQSLLPIHQMKVQLPLENWYDLLTLVPRSQLGNVVSQIGDRQFAYIIQSFLHDPVKEITLGEMRIIPPRRGVGTDRTMVKVWPNKATNMPDCPMPANVKNFMGIYFKYVNTSALNFLQKFQENSLLSNVNLGFGLPPNGNDGVMQDLTQIVPLVNINSIDSINSPVFDLMEMAYSNNNNNDGRMIDESSQLLLKKVLEMARILALPLDNWGYHPHQAYSDWCFSWLNTPRDDGRPRMLIFCNYHNIYDTTFPSIIERFKEDFEMANRSVSFFIRVRIIDNNNVQPDYISFTNVKTNEKLVIKTKMLDDNSKKLLISRYPLNAAKNWIEANENEICEWDPEKLNRKIYVAWSENLNSKCSVKMTDDNNLSIPNLTVGTNTDGGHENDGNELNELKLEMITLKATVQVLQTEKQQLVEKEKQYEKEIANLKRKLTEQEDGCEAKHKKLGTVIHTSQQEIVEMAESEESLLPIHQMKVQLPLENWHDLLALVPRSQLGNVVSEIGDYQFAYIIQSFLHDPVRKITLGEMSIIPPRRGVGTDRTMVKVWPNEATNMPDWPMPWNVKNFVAIHLKYLVDVSALNFLQKFQFQENSLLDNVNLGFGLPPTRNGIMRDLTQIVPLVNSIDSINSPVYDLLEMVYSNNNDNEDDDDDDDDGHKIDESTQLLLKKMMEMARIQAFKLDEWECRREYRDKIDWCFSWLYTPRDDGRPRMLISGCHIIYEDACPYLIDRFKEDFQMANRSVSFFVRIQVSIVQPEYISIDNAKTNEKLVIETKRDDGYYWKLLISRYPLNAAKNWIEANENEISEWHTSKLDRKIYVAWTDEFNM